MSPRTCRDCGREGELTCARCRQRRRRQRIGRDSITEEDRAAMERAAARTPIPSWYGIATEPLTPEAERAYVRDVVELGHVEREVALHAALLAPGGAS